MADFAIEAGVTVTLQNMQDALQALLGSEPDDTAGDFSEQNMIAAINCVYWDLLEAGIPQGYTKARVEAWLEGAGLYLHLYCSLAICLTNRTHLTSSHQAMLERYEKKCEEFKKGKAVLLDVNGDIITRDTSTSDLQAEDTFRNGTAGAQHDFVFDWNQQQFSGGVAAENAAAFRFGNNRLGGLS